MLYIALGFALVALIWWGGGKALLKRREWRFLTAATALVAFAGAAYAGVRGAWGILVVLLVLGLWLSISSRHAAPKPAAAPSAKGGCMSLADARALLGVEADATPDEIKAAYTRLMRLAHPDKGGTVGLATQLNAARDRLLRK